MTSHELWRLHSRAAVQNLRHAMEQIRLDGAQAWKEGLLLEALHKLETALMDEDDDQEPA